MKTNNTPTAMNANETKAPEMKKIFKVTAAIVGIVAAVVILNYFMKALGCLLIYISDTCNVPL